MNNLNSDLSNLSDQQMYEFLQSYFFEVLQSTELGAY